MPAKLDLLVHITHEAGVKVGGIGAVLNGLLGADRYQKAVARTIVVGPYHAAHHNEMARLFAPENGLRLLYAADRGIILLPEVLAQAFHSIETTFDVSILYGFRPFGGVEHEVLLLDTTHINPQRSSDFKYSLWQNFGLDTARYEQDEEFRQFVELAEPAYAALWQLAQGAGARQALLAHEWMGIPLALTAMQRDAERWRTWFYAHEVATVRRLIEEHPGQDTRFYNVMRLALPRHLSIHQVFGPQDDFFKHALLRQITRFDGVLAVGDLVVDELRFLAPELPPESIHLVYNGAPALPLTLAAKQKSQALLRDYARALLDFSPDFIFSHVTRFVLSKGLWRDIRVLTHLDRIFQQAGKTGVLFILSSAEPTGRDPDRVRQWEAAYGWPLHHRADNGDLLGLETDFFFQVLAPFNQRSKAIKAVLVNQFGWDRARCGQRMPAAMSFMDLRHGTDVEFGQSIYEPFGIAQVEPLSFGALCVPSTICGAVGFVQRASSGLSDFPNLIPADFVTPPADWRYENVQDALGIDQDARDRIERQRSRRVAERIATYLPLTDAETAALLDKGQVVARRMSWDVVVDDYLLPALMT